MTAKELQISGKSLNLFLEKGQLYDAFYLMLGISESMMMWEVSDKIKMLRDNYLYMLDYAIKGVADKDRKMFISAIADELYTIFDNLLVTAKLSENNYGIFYDTLRNISDGNEKLNDFLTQYNDIRSGNYNISISADQEKDIFYILWTSLNLSDSQLQNIESVCLSHLTTHTLQNLILAALFLRSLNIGFSKKILSFFYRIYRESSDQEISIRALTLFVLLIFTFRKRVTGQIQIDIDLTLTDALQNAKNDITDIIIELIRTFETSRINDRINNDIIPNMIKIAPQIKERFRNFSEEDLLELEDNPGWQDIMKKTGLEQNLREINRLQIEGADVMMSTFANLKNFPFFNDVHNWFVPFDEKAVSNFDNSEETNTFFSSMAKTRILCDSDLYSFMFSFINFPKEQRFALISNVDEQFRALQEMSSQNKDDSATKRFARLYIRNLFRFFNLFRRKGEFTNPFNFLTEINLHPIIFPLINDTKTLDLIIDFYMKMEMWNEAFSVLQSREKNFKPSADLYLKMGYCLQKMSDFERAYNYYIHAEMLEADNIWTLKKIARCARIIGKWSTALNYYRKIEEIENDNVGIALAVGKCEMELGNYKNAVKAFYKAYYLDPSHKISLMLCQALLLAGEIDNASSQLEKIMEVTADIESLILAGHLEFSKGNYEKALVHFSNAYKLNSNDSKNNDFVHRLLADKDLYITTNDKAELFSLLIEKLKFSLDR